MVRIRKQHYVPQFYLKNFGIPIHCFDKIDDKMFKTNTTRIAFETDFYGIAVQGGDSIEKVMASMDGKFSGGYNALVTKHKNSSTLSFEEAADFWAFLAVQYLRTKEHKDLVVNNTQQFFDQIVANLGINDWEIKINDFGKVGLHLMSLQNWPLYSSILGQMKFVFLNNKTDIPFWTSDNPVALTNQYPQPPFGNLGIISRGIEIHFPLTPEYCLVACDPTVYGNVSNSLILTNENNVKYENLLRINSATRHIFSNKDDFDFAKQVLDNKFNPNDVERSLPSPSFQRINNNRADYWPEPELLSQIFQLMNSV